MTTLTVGTVPEGVPFRLIRCARNYELELSDLARTFRAGDFWENGHARWGQDAADICCAFALDRPVVLVETIGQCVAKLKNAPAIWYCANCNTPSKADGARGCVPGCTAKT